MNHFLTAFLVLACSAARAASDFPVAVRGADEAAFSPATPERPALLETGKYDALVVGGGLAGMTSALYLSDQGKKVLLLEKEDNLGGLAFGGDMKGGARFNRGAAYWTSAYEEELKILEHFGLGGYKDAYAIHEPIDSYLWKGKLYAGIWDAETLKKLPASFELFKHELLLADKAKLIPNQPIEESGALELDNMNAAEWVRLMPDMASQRGDEESKKIFKRYAEDPAVGRTDPMEPVLDLLDLYTRSALGATTGKVSALAFANFYISEVETRFTTPLGTGEAARLLEAALRSRKGLVDIRLKSPAVKLESAADSVTATFLQNGKPRKAQGAFAVFAGQLKFAPKIIAGLSEADPIRAALISALDYSHYSVHAVFVKGHPYRETFDTWVRPYDYGENDFTDVILGRWMDPAIKGYQGMRDFKKDPADEGGVLTIYHPLSLEAVGGGYSKTQAADLARKAVERMLEVFSPLLKETWGTHIEVKSVETSRWPYSVHVARPGHFLKVAKILRKPLGRVFFANNNLGTPAFEEALFRGHCAANNILKRLDPAFAQETWTRCPLD